MDVIVDHVKLPDKRFAAAWEAIKIEDAVRNRLAAQSLLILTLRAKLPFEVAPLHGLILLSGPPGTGKTTLARGLANKVSEALGDQGATFVQIDPHALASSALGRSQQEMTKLFQQTIPELATNGPTVILLDEVETLIADRQKLSLEANPIDVHRATDAALAGLDLLTRRNLHILLLATTNFPKAIDKALLSRADLVQDIGLPNDDARSAIINEVLDHLAQHWPSTEQLMSNIGVFVAESDGMDGRRLRKAMISALAASTNIACDPNQLRTEHLVDAIQAAKKQMQMEEQ